MNYGDYIGRGFSKSTSAARPPTYLPNVSEWVDKIYCIETEDQQYTADRVLGGLYGISNAQAQALANRTYILKEQQAKIVEVVNALLQALSPTLSTIKELVVTTGELSDPAHQAKLDIGLDIESPNVRVTWANGSVSNNPTFRVTLTDGTVYAIRTDGQSTGIEPIVFFEEE